MQNLDEVIRLANDIRQIRIDTREIEEYKGINEVQKSQIEELEKKITGLQKTVLDQKKLSKRISELESEKKSLFLKYERLKGNYAFVVTSPGIATKTVYGEISREISTAENEILICSPWITYIIDELDSVKKRGNIELKIITRLVKEDVESGILDLNKLRALTDEFGAEIRYNNDLHAKMVVVDKRVAIISSANLTKTGLNVNYEAGVCLREEDVLKSVGNFFDEMWKEGTPLTEEIMEAISTK